MDNNIKDIARALRGVLPFANLNTRPTNELQSLLSYQNIDDINLQQGKLIIESSISDFILQIQNKYDAAPYGLWIKDAPSPTVGFPLLNITSADGLNTYMRIDSNTGQVGIGTDLPSSALDVQGVVTVNDTIRLDTGDTTVGIDDVYGDIEFYDNDGGTASPGVTARIQAVATSSYGASKLVFSTSNSGGGARTPLTDHVLIDGVGNLGIGTDSPKDKLHIKIGTDLNWQFGYPSSSVTTLAALNDAESAYVTGRIDAGPLELNGQSGGDVNMGGGILFVDTSADRVGIGTVSPNAPLHLESLNSPEFRISRTNNAAATSQPLQISAYAPDASGNTAESFGDIRVIVDDATHGSEDSHWSFRSHNVGTVSEDMVIGYNGNVGIGTSEPTATLTVAGPNTQTSLGGPNALNIMDGNADNEFVTLNFQTGAGGPLAAIGAKAITTGVYPNTVGELHFAVQKLNARFTAMVIDEDRQVGIGTSAPETRLHIGGTSQFIKMDSGTTTHLYLGGENDFFALSHNRHPSTGVIDDAALGVGVIQYENAVGWSFSANTGGAFTNRMSILNDGNVGIGRFTNLQGKLDVDGDLRVTRNIAANTVWEMISLGSDRSLDDYGGLYKDYWRINVVTPGPTTTGEVDDHRFGDLRFSGVTGVNTTYEDRLTIKYNGNVGVGIAALSNWSSDFSPVIQIATPAGGANAITGDGIGNFRFLTNLYLDATGPTWKHYETGAVAVYQMDNGEHIFYGGASGTKDSTANFSQTMLLDVNGRLHLTNNGTPQSLADLNIVTGGSAGGIKLINGVTPSLGTDLGAITFAGVDSANNNVVSEASIVAKSTEAHGPTNAGTELIFSTKPNGTGPGSSPTPRMIIRQGGDVSIEDGNLVVASPHGIDFGATSDGPGTTESELLNDYEEGTYTPTLTSTDGNLVLSYTGSPTNQKGFYVRVGENISVSFKIDATVTTVGTGFLRLSLPFTSDSDAVFRSGGVLCFVRGVTNYGSGLTLNLGPNSSNAGIFGYRDADDFDLDIVTTDLSSSITLHGQITYRSI